MNLRENLKSRFNLSGINPDQLILTLLTIYHKLSIPINQDHLMYLVSERLVCRDVTGKLMVTIGIYTDEDDPIVRNKGDTIVDAIDRLKEFRDLFKGIRTGSMGDKNLVVDNLIKFINQENIDMDTIINATKQFINATGIYTPNADTFIYREKDGRITSPLRTAIEEYGDSNQQSQYKLI